ncbi:MAG: ribonuclease PH [Trueperaceae bacterium]|nr:ribonuclease PH [Trueperaceae bacterium]MCO5172643.1 ribonuclease PH [Trueperaceae bacterium]MCW5820790.1 ribonuclease PH [Trueperaceae bacterium]
MSAHKREGRAATELRPVNVELGYNPHAEGSAVVTWGRTVIAATVTIEAKLPPHLRATAHKGGWLTAEYALLPRSTKERVARERLYASGRTQEIQRLMGRALRSTVDLDLFKGKTVTVDADVLVADGGTRCAAILAGYAALHQAADRLVFQGGVAEWPLRHELAAVSVGVVNGETRVDLDHAEDAAAELDLNVVATATGDVLEVQGGSETGPVSAERYVTLVAAGVAAVERLVAQVRGQLK